MRSVFVLVIAALLSISVCPVHAGEKAPSSLKALKKRLDRITDRIQKLLEEAGRDPDEHNIALYKSYSGKELKTTRGRIRAVDLVGYMLDGKKRFPVRERAQLALYQGGTDRGDPDLSPSTKSGSRTKRAAFCEKHLLKPLRSPNRYTRALAHRLLVMFYGRVAPYNPNVEATWKKAASSWKKYLKKQ